MPEAPARSIMVPYGRLPCLLFLLAALVLLGACERPFVDERTPEIEVVTDLSTAFGSAALDLRVSAHSFRSVDSVAVNGVPMQYEPASQQWRQAVRLRAGLNTLRLTATDAHGLVRIDTAYALYLPVTYTGFAPDLPAPRGGHTTTLLPDGSLVVLGGAAEAGGDALGTGALLRPQSAGFVSLRETLHAPRTGHTASLLPDGRILLIGGSRSDDLDEIDDLIETIETYDPRTDAFAVVPYDGPPIRRALHTAVVRETANGLFIDLYGGRGDLRYGTSPRLGDRRDLAILELHDDSLFARSPQPGPFLDDGGPLWGHTQTPLDSPVPGTVQRYLVAGGAFPEGAVENVVFRVDYTTPGSIQTAPAAPMRTPRTRHAAVWLQPGYVMLFGGRQRSPSETVDVPEVYVEAADRFFYLPVPPDDPAKRYGLSATKLPGNRILLVGGFSPAGNGITTSEVFEAASF